MRRLFSNNHFLPCGSLMSLGFKLGGRIRCHEAQQTGVVSSLKKNKTQKNAFVADPNPYLFAATTQADRKIETVLFKLFKS